MPTAAILMWLVDHLEAIGLIAVGFVALLTAVRHNQLRRRFAAHVQREHATPLWPREG